MLGRVTQVKVRTIDDIPNQAASWSTKAIYYDADGQAIQGVSDGTILGTSAKMTVLSKLGWHGQLQEVKEVQTFGTITTTMLRTYAYYDNGALKNLTASYNGGVTTILASYTYDDLGRVKEKLIGNASQSQRYTYNIRGWLTQINDPNSAVGTDLFALKLAYETPEVGVTAAAQYAGNISSATWQSRTSTTAAASKKTYGYSYDGLNRLTTSDFVGGSTATSLEESGIFYDLNGNIQTLKRTNADGTATSYSYTYSGNQLASVTSSKSGSYTYDDNGNMLTDGRKGMTFTYNPLNMISTVTSGTSVLRNLYDATGIRLATVNPDGSTTFYHGSMVYSKPASGTVTLKYTLHEEGMVMATNATYQYLLKDNQDNTRVAYTNVSGQAQVVQSTDYYPYGKPHGVMNADKTPYLYTGKELQNQYVGAQPLNLMDYGARYYDYELGRWHSMDPLAEKFHSMSSYAFCGNNPIGSVDNNGMDHRPWYWNEPTMGEWTALKEANEVYLTSIEHFGGGDGGGGGASWGNAYANALVELAPYHEWYSATGGHGDWNSVQQNGYYYAKTVGATTPVDIISGSGMYGYFRETVTLTKVYVISNINLGNDNLTKNRFPTLAVGLSTIGSMADYGSGAFNKLLQEGKQTVRVSSSTLKVLSGATNIANVAIGANKIIEGEVQPIDKLNIAIGTAGAVEFISSNFFLLEIPVVGEFTAVYGALSSEWDVFYNLGQEYGPISTILGCRKGR